MSHPYDLGEKKKASILGPTLKFKGELTANEDLVIQGQVEGSIKHSSNLTIGEAGKLKANIEALRVLPRALRLRGLGGQIVVDMAPLSKRDRKQVESVARAAFRTDPIETTLVDWTPLGHLELVRKRERLPLRDLLR